jgi:hypothetical protein
MLSITPSAWKGATENAVARDEDNNLIGNDGLPAVQRTDEQWRTRMATGIRPQTEAIEREGTWAARQKQLRDQERQKEISATYKRAIINNTIDSKAEKLEAEYQDRGGDIENLLRLYQEAALEQNKTQKERMEGTPTTQQSVRRYNYFNK